MTMLKKNHGITDGVPDESHSQRAGMYDHFNCAKSRNQKYWYKVCQMKVTAWRAGRYDRVPP